MGKRGPPRIPLEILQARGSTLTKGREREAAATATPMIEYRIPVKPLWLSLDAGEVWESLLPILTEMGLARLSDGDTIGRYCQTLADWVRVDAILRKEGESYETETGAKRLHPLCRLRREAATGLKELSDRLGLSPSARSSLHLTAGAKAEPAKPPVNIDGERFFRKI